MKAIPGWTLALLMALALPCAAQEKSGFLAKREERVTGFLRQAEALYQQGKVDAARVACHEAFLIDPYDIRVHRMIVRVPLILQDSGGELRETWFRKVTPPNSAMEMQQIRFRAISTGVLSPPLNPQLGK